MRRLVPLALVLLTASIVCPTASRAQGRPSVSAQKRALIAQRNVLRDSLAVSKAIYYPNNPEVLAIRRRLKAVDKRLTQLHQQLPENSQDVIRQSRVCLLTGQSTTKP